MTKIEEHTTKDSKTGDSSTLVVEAPAALSMVTYKSSKKSRRVSIMRSTIPSSSAGEDVD